MQETSLELRHLQIMIHVKHYGTLEGEKKVDTMVFIDNKITRLLNCNIKIKISNQCCNLEI